MTPDFEKLGVFYLGRDHDLQTGETKPNLLLYDSKDLTTHAVCVGMTGSGKTGLCLSLLEEAAIDGIPAIAIDPKGDLGNLLLAFEQLRPQDFLPWIDASAAARKGQTPQQFAESTANLWRKGLQDWGQDRKRIARYRDAVDIAIYTPGSNAGLPLTVLKSFNAPAAAVLADEDALRERIASAASGLLALLGIDADPVRSREHILLSNVLASAWRAGRDLDIAQLIQEIQSPPFSRVGVLDLDTFFPADDRLDLAMKLNNLLASPSFASWMEGEPLDIKRLLYTRQGGPRLTIISIAHLNDSERMFFVTILLNEVLAWMRSQPGTSSLRALLYMDEIYGYFPPTANPPSKRPMLTLLKQARAFGLGCVLSTQNPVDLDYKGLANAGTWFLGRLQTERDKARVLEGLEGASAQAGSTFDRGKMEETLAALGSRVFLMNNVHDDAPTVFHTRWALSYLRGPLTRQQIKQLMDPRRDESTSASAEEAQRATPPPVTKADTAGAKAPAAVTAPTEAGAVTPPQGPQSIPVYYVATSEVVAAPSRIVYRPGLLGSGKLHFVRATYDVDYWRPFVALQSIHGEMPRVVWDNCYILSVPPHLRSSAEANSSFVALPAELQRERNYKVWQGKLRDHVYRSQKAKIWRSKPLKLLSEPDEDEGDFRIRLAQLAREKRDLEIEKLRAKHAASLATLQDRISRAVEKMQREKSQYREQQTKAVVSLGASILGAIFGRKLASVRNVSKASSSAKSMSRAAREKGDVERAELRLTELREKLAEMESKFSKDVEGIQAKYGVDALQVESIELPPRKSDIIIDRVVIVWLPWRVSEDGSSEPVY